MHEGTKARVYLMLGAGMLALSITAFVGIHDVRAMITTQMDFGSQGSDVTELQLYLARNSDLYPSGLITGYFGPLTQSGVERFQVAQGIVSAGTPGTTGYGRVGPLTGARINMLMGSTVQGDVWSPLISNELVSTDRDSATISWTVLESAKSRVMYGKTWPFLYSTAASVSTNGFGTAPRITITNLDANTVYYYVRESVDTSGNITWTIKDTFKTDN